MIPASVGFQCPECVGAGQVRQPVSPVGGALIIKPYVTYVLIGINTVLFIFSFLGGIEVVASNFGMVPPAIALDNEYWRLLTAAFLHGSVLHILFNMYVLFVIGQSLERILGHVRYVVLYLVAALGGSVASYVFSDFMTISVGASGAIFGLMGALVVAGRRLRYDISQVLILLAINVFIGFIAPGVDWRAHLGGLAVGAAVAAIFVWAPKAGRVIWQTIGVSGIVLILIGTALWRTARIQQLIVDVHSVVT